MTISPYVPPRIRITDPGTPKQPSTPRKRGTTGTSGGGNTALTAEQRNAQILLNSVLAEWGLASLAPKLLEYIKAGYSADAITLLLQETQEYKTRFSGNELRRKAGLAPLAPREYLATEEAYKVVLRESGLPVGFYDGPDDFTSWIGSAVSPAEVKRRADLAFRAVESSDPNYRRYLRDVVGITTSQMAAYWLDEKRALPIIERQAAAAGIGAQALKQGLDPTDLERALRYAESGVSEDDAARAYSTIAEILPTEQNIARRYNSDISQGDLEDEALGGMASSRRKRRELNQMEQAQFEQGSGVNQGSLGRPASGAY